MEFIVETGIMLKDLRPVIGTVAQDTKRIAKNKNEYIDFFISPPENKFNIMFDIIKDICR